MEVVSNLVNGTIDIASIDLEREFQKFIFNSYRLVVHAVFQRSPMPGQLSRQSVSMSMLPTSRSRSNLRLTDDEELRSSYSTKSLSSLQGVKHPIRVRPSYQAGKMRGKYNYLDDIEVHARVLSL